MIELFQNKLQDIILYGSYARNENTSESDMDNMIFELAKYRLEKSKNDIEEKLNKE